MELLGLENEEISINNPLEIINLLKTTQFHIHGWKTLRGSWIVVATGLRLSAVSISRIAFSQPYEVYAHLFRLFDNSMLPNTLATTEGHG